MEEFLKNYVNNNFNYIYEYDIYNKLLYLFIINKLSILLFSVDENGTKLVNSIELNNSIEDKNRNINTEKSFFEINFFVPNQISLILNKQLIILSKFKLEKCLIYPKRILTAHFSYFENYMGLLFEDKFIYLDINNDNKITTFNTEEKNIIDFDFVKKYQRSLEIFDVFFLHKNGNISVIGPIFPKKFKIEKLYLINCQNFINNQIYYSNEAKLCSNLIKNLEEKCLSKEDENYYYFEIKNEYENVNSNLNEKEIIIIKNNNFKKIDNNEINTNQMIKLIDDKEHKNNDNKEIINYSSIRKFKKIFILFSNPIILFRISIYNEIDVITITENFYCYRINFDLNFNFDENNVTNINENYLIERINLFRNKNNNEDNHKIKIYNYINNNNIHQEYEKIINNYNNKFIIGINNNIFYLELQYVNVFKNLYDNINDVINTSIQSTVIKLINNDINKNNKEIIFYPFLDKIYFTYLIDNKNILSNSIEIKQSRKKKFNNLDIDNNNNKDNNNDNKDNNNNSKNNNISIDKDINPIQFEKIEKNKIRLDLDSFNELGKNNSNVNQLIESNIIKISEYYENIINNNYNKINNKLDKLIEFYSYISDKTLKEKYDELNMIIENIKKKEEEINDNNKKILEKINQIKQKLEKKENINSRIYLSKIKKFEEEYKNKLIKYDKSFKTIKDKINEINNFNLKNVLNNDFPITTNNINKNYIIGSFQLLNNLSEFITKLTNNNN
jgi:hypothetical protein